MKKLLIVAALAATGPLHTAAFANDGEVHQHDVVLRIADGVPVGYVETIRTANRIQSIIRTSDLDPGSVVTVWWRVYNRPARCAVPNACTVADLSNPDVDGSQLHAASHRVSESDGSAVIVASLYRTAMKAQGGDRLASTLKEAHLSGRGLRRPLNADVELVLVSHGRAADPAIDGDLAAMEQLLTPGGTMLDCIDAAIPDPGRRFRCGALQIANMPPMNFD